MAVLLSSAACRPPFVQPSWPQQLYTAGLTVAAHEKEGGETHTPLHNENATSH